MCNSSMVKTTAGLLAALVIGGAASAQTETKTLRVATYGGSWLQAVQSNIEPEFKRLTGADVEYTVGGPREALGKVMAAGGSDVPFDVVDWPNDIQAQAVKQGLVQKINPARVPNLSLLQPEAVLQPGYGPATSWVISGLIYNRGKFEAVGIGTPATYDAMLDPKLKGHVALPDIRNPVSPAFLSGLSKDLEGDEDAIDAALKFLSDVDDPIFYPNFAVLQSRFSSGDIWLFPGNIGYALRLRDGGHDVDFTRPKVVDKQAVAQANVFDIIKGTEQLDLAHVWLNVAMKADVQAKMARLTGYSPTNKEAATEIGQDEELARYHITDGAAISNLFFPDWNKVNEAYPQWMEKWNRAIRR